MKICLTLSFLPVLLLPLLLPWTSDPAPTLLLSSSQSKSWSKSSWSLRRGSPKLDLLVFFVKKNIVLELRKKNNNIIVLLRERKKTKKSVVILFLFTYNTYIKHTVHACHVLANFLFSSQLMWLVWMISSQSVGRMTAAMWELCCIRRIYTDSSNIYRLQFASDPLLLRSPSSPSPSLV